MTTKVRKKPCRHCLFTKNHLGPASEIEEMRGHADAQTFTCHEHSEAVVCCMWARRHGVDDPEFINQNGDLKAHFCNMTRAQMDSCGFTRGAAL